MTPFLRKSSDPDHATRHRAIGSARPGPTAGSRTRSELGAWSGRSGWNRHYSLPAAGLAALLLVAFRPLPSAYAAPDTWLATADAPVRAIRDTSLYRLGAGASIGPADIVETETGIVQLQFAQGALALVGPSTRLRLLPSSDGASRVALALIGGWIKLQIPADGSGGSILVATPRLLVAVDRGACIVSSEAARTAVFVESGQGRVASPGIAGPAGPWSEVRSEQMALRPEGGGVQILPRVQRDFVDTMPAAFRDPLTPVRGSPSSARPSPLRAVTYADVDAWLSAPLHIRIGLASRFRGRLADPAFRGAVDANLARLPDWREFVRPPPDAHPEQQRKRPVHGRTTLPGHTRRRRGRLSCTGRG